jgi:hypothetical protein
MSCRESSDFRHDFIAAIDFSHLSAARCPAYLALPLVILAGKAHVRGAKFLSFVFCPPYGPQHFDRHDAKPGHHMLWVAF